MQNGDVHLPRDDHPILRVCFAFALRFELVGGVLGSGIVPPTEQTLVGNPELKGADRSVELMSIVVQYALLTLHFCGRPPPMQDADRKPYK